MIRLIPEEGSKITDAEWEVMRVVWALKKVSSKEISDVLKEKKDWKINGKR